MIYKSKGDYKLSLEYYQKCLKIYINVVGENHVDVAKSYNNIGLVYNSKGDYTLALEYLSKSLEIKINVLG